MLRKRSRPIFALAVASCLLAFSVIHAQTTPAPAACPSVLPSDGVSTAVALLDRIDRIVTNVRKDVDTDDVKPVTTTGQAGASGTVTIRAEDLDEIRAEIAQIKLLLHPKAP